MKNIHSEKNEVVVIPALFAQLDNSIPHLSNTLVTKAVEQGIDVKQALEKARALNLEGTRKNLVKADEVTLDVLAELFPIYATMEVGIVYDKITKEPIGKLLRHNADLLVKKNDDSLVVDSLENYIYVLYPIPELLKKLLQMYETVREIRTNKILEAAQFLDALQEVIKQ